MRLIFVLFVSLCTNLLFGQTAKYSNEFLRIGVGADALARAGAVVSLSDGVQAGYWNPALLTQTKERIDLASMHAAYFSGLANYDYLGASYRIDTTSVIAINIIRFGVDDIQNTIDLFDANGNIDYARISKFSVADYAFLLSYAKQTRIKGLSIGGNLKVIYRSQGKFASAWGIGIDAALHYQHNKWSFGAILRDASTTVNSWSFDEEALRVESPLAENPTPTEAREITLPSLTLGTSRTFVLKPDWELSASVDLDIFFDGERNGLFSGFLSGANPKTSLELGYHKFLFVRTGVGNFTQQINFDGNTTLRVTPYAGIGVKYLGFTLNYALGNIANVGGGKFSNYFSLNYRIL